jgi:hypothetical protein
VDRVPSRTTWPPTWFTFGDSAAVEAAAVEPEVVPFSALDAASDCDLAPWEEPDCDAVSDAGFDTDSIDARSVEIVCPRCGSSDYRDFPVHGGDSIRRDCARCDLCLYYPIWGGTPQPQPADTIPPRLSDFGFALLSVAPDDGDGRGWWGHVPFEDRLRLGERVRPAELEQIANDFARAAGLGNRVFAADTDGDAVRLRVVDNSDARTAHDRLTWVDGMLRKYPLSTRAEMENGVTRCLSVLTAWRELPQPCTWCGGRTRHNPKCVALRDDWAVTMPLGKFKGRPIRDIDAGYLRWVRSSGMELEAEVRAEIERTLED